MMKLLFVFLFVALAFIQCNNNQRQKESHSQISIEATEVEGYFIVQHNKSGEEFGIRLDQNGLLLSVSVIRNGNFAKVSLDSLSNLSEFIQADIDRNMGYKQYFDGNLLHKIVEYDNFEKKGVGQELFFQNSFLEKKSFFVRITEVSEHKFKFEPHAPFPYDVLNISIGKVNDERIYSRSGWVVDTTFQYAPQTVILDVPSDKFEGFVSFGATIRKDSINFRPIYFQFPRSPFIDKALSSPVPMNDHPNY